MLQVNEALSYDQDAIGIGRKGTIDKPFLLKSPFWTVDTLFYCIPKINSNLFFIYGVFQKINWKKMDESTGVPSLSKNTINNISINIPTLNEQNRIGKLLIVLDKSIALHHRKLDRLKNLNKAYLEHMFPKKTYSVPKLRFNCYSDVWEQRKLGDLGKVSMNKRIFKDQTFESGDVPFYKIGTFGGVPDAYISRELFEDYKSKYPYPTKGDILISASGSIGRTVVYQGGDEYFQDSNIVWLNHEGRIDNKFLNQFYSIVKWEGLEGSTIKRLYNKNILETSIKLPTLTEQKKIGGFFDKFDKIIDLHQRKIDSLKELKNSSLHLLFV